MEIFIRRNSYNYTHTNTHTQNAHVVETEMSMTNKTEVQMTKLCKEIAWSSRCKIKKVTI